MPTLNCNVLRQINQAGLELITRFEQGPKGGPALVAYQDSAGIWTIGYGHTYQVYENQIATRNDALRWLDGDLATSEDSVCTHVSVPLTDNQYAALVSLCFNIGRYAFEASTLLKYVNLMDFADVPTQLLRWNHIRGMVSAGLTNRRQAEADLWLT